MSAKTVVVPVMLAAFVGGCVEYDERIELNTDGSGTVRMHLAVSERVLAGMTTAGAGKEAAVGWVLAPTRYWSEGRRSRQPHGVVDAD